MAKASSIKSKPLVYLACPFWHDDPEIRAYRRNKAIEYSERLFAKGIPFYSPLMYSERFKERKATEGYWINHGLRMVDVCDEMHVLCLDGWEKSSGIKGEVAKAKERNVEIKYIRHYARVSFHGSRSLSLKDVKPVFESVMERLQVEVAVTHGEPEGACAHIRSLCKSQGVPLMLHHLDKSRAQGMHHWRSVAVLEDSEIAVFLHDGASQGTQNELMLALKMDIPHEYYVLKGKKLERKDTRPKQSEKTDDLFGEIGVLEPLDLDLGDSEFTL